MGRGTRQEMRLGRQDAAQGLSARATTVGTTRKMAPARKGPRRVAVVRAGRVEHCRWVDTTRYQELIKALHVRGTKMFAAVRAGEDKIWRRGSFWRSYAPYRRILLLDTSPKGSARPHRNPLLLRQSQTEHLQLHNNRPVFDWKSCFSRGNSPFFLHFQ